MAWYWWVLVVDAVLVVVRILDGLRLQQRMLRKDTPHRERPRALHHAAWTRNGRGCTFYVVGNEIRWRYDVGIDPRFEDMLTIELELTALELSLGRRPTNPELVNQAHELNAARQRGESPA